MGLFTWLKSKLNGGKISLGGWDVGEFADEYATLVADVYIREMAFWSAVNIIANSVSKCEFKTYIDHEEVRGREYYLWNVEPNKNQNSSEFIRQWISQLYRNNECLIIEYDGELLIADSFNRTPYALREDIFTDVEVKGFSFDKAFYQSEVLYFKLSEENMKKVTDGLFQSYSKLISYSMDAYQKSRGTKGIFKYETLPVAGTEERKVFDALINEKIETWLNSDKAALPLGKGQEWKELDKKTYSAETTRDIRALIDDIGDFTARAFSIPPLLLKGNVAGLRDSVNNLLTFCIKPLVTMLAEEINRKRNGYKGFSSGTYLKIDTRSLKHYDIFDIATSIDKLIASGVYSVNDILEAIGDNPIEEDWAYKHWITKNYGEIEGALEGAEGNEK